MQVRLLGPIEIDADSGRSITLSAAKERSLVAALALAGGGTVSTGLLISSLWGEEPPGAARKTLQTYVWNLRQALGAEQVITEPMGYRLLVSRDEVDAHCFRTLVRDGDAALRDGHGCFPVLRIDGHVPHIAAADTPWPVTLAEQSSA